MDMDIILAIAGVIIGALISWLITHIYYKKSLKNQEVEASRQISEWKKLVNNQVQSSQEALKLQYIEQAIAEYKRAGTPVRVIDTFNIPISEKADIYDAVMRRVKGRLGKSNKYRDQPE